MNGNPIGLRNPNPILDTRNYEVELPDRSVETYAVNIIAESFMSNVDDEGNFFLLIDEIIDHRKNDEAVDSIKL